MISIKKVIALQDIQYVVLQCATDLFDQRINNIERLSALSEKFSKFADVAVAYDSEAVMGYVAYYCNDSQSKIAYISVIVVKNEYQGKGVGSCLFNHVISHLKEKNFIGLQLEVAKDNQNALKFYSNKGFTNIEDRPSSLLLQILF